MSDGPGRSLGCRRVGGSPRASTGGGPIEDRPSFVAGLRCVRLGARLARGVVTAGCAGEDRCLSGRRPARRDLLRWGVGRTWALADLRLVRGWARCLPCGLATGRRAGNGGAVAAPDGLSSATARRRTRRRRHRPVAYESSAVDSTSIRLRRASWSEERARDRVPRCAVLGRAGSWRRDLLTVSRWSWSCALRLAALGRWTARRSVEVRRRWGAAGSWCRHRRGQREASRRSSMCVPRLAVPGRRTARRPVELVGAGKRLARGLGFGGGSGRRLAGRRCARHDSLCRGVGRLDGRSRFVGAGKRLARGVVIGAGRGRRLAGRRFARHGSLCRGVGRLDGRSRFVGAGKRLARGLGFGAGSGRRLAGRRCAGHGSLRRGVGRLDGRSRLVGAGTSAGSWPCHGSTRARWWGEGRAGEAALVPQREPLPPRRARQSARLGPPVEPRQRWGAAGSWSPPERRLGGRCAGPSRLRG